MDNRPDFDTYYLDIADVVATRGDCRRSQVGAVLVSRDGRRVTFGYNGTELPKQPGCLDGACPRGLQSYAYLPPGGSYDNCIAVHAEANCEYWDDLWIGATMYITRAPCDDCVTGMTNADLARVVWRTRAYETTWSKGPWVISELLLQERR